MIKRNKLKMSDLGEFGFIRSIQENCHFSHSKWVKGIGDDCAVIGPYEGRVLLVTTDLLVEDVHFILKKIPLEHLGEKALSVNLSDIAAMGGKALHGFISLAVPRAMGLESIHAFYRGLKNVCRQYGVDILGGDTAASPDRLMINVTVIGEAPQDEVLFRSGARPGDHIYVTGNMGDSAGGLKLIKEEASAPKSIASSLIKAHNRPKPFLDAGRMIARSRLASAMIDLSDGLTSDLRHICEASRVGAKLSRETLPLSRELRTMAEQNRLDPYEMALSGGEDYGLLVTTPKNNADPFLEMFKKNAPCPIFCIGEITENLGIEIALPDGTTEPLDAKGFDHFI